GFRPVISACTCTPSATSVNVTVPLTLLPAVGCSTAMAFKGVGGFSCGVCARAGMAVRERIINTTNQLGNECIFIFLFVAQAWSSRMIGLILASALLEN